MTGLLPSILVAGVSSNCGKTTVTLGLMAALKESGIHVQPFKCGPDFIDPTLHEMVTGNTSWNLDIRMCGKKYVRSLFAQEATRNGINVIEGVMGLFDGGEASAASLAALLSIPVILVVDSSSSAESIAAVVKGFESMPQLPGGIAGVILNRVASPRHLELARSAVHQYCRAPVIGWLPRKKTIEIPSRHLGLFMGSEAPLGKDISILSSLIRSHLDMDAVIQISRKSRGPGICAPAFSQDADEACRGPEVTIAIARDRAFCFYYPDNLRIIQCRGAELVPFSPTGDERLPEGISGIYLGGGYPELSARALSENQSMREEITGFARSGRPLLAECGGFMYLCRSITTATGRRFEMAGVFPADSFMQERLSSLGYRRAQLTRACPLGTEGKRLFGHEFHYSRTEFFGQVKTAFRLEDGRNEGYLSENTLAGYMHMHFGRTPGAAARFVETCRKARPWRH